MIPLFQAPDIAQKMAEAPDKNYEIGVVIGTYLPVVVLICIAFGIYYYFKKKQPDTH